MPFRKGVELGAGKSAQCRMCTAATDAERGSPSMIASSPTIPPRPMKDRIRSIPERETIVTAHPALRSRHREAALLSI
jgi:hypothetical protein